MLPYSERRCGQAASLGAPFGGLWAAGAPPLRLRGDSAA